MLKFQTDHNFLHWVEDDMGTVTSQSGGMGSGWSGLIEAGVDDLMQSTEFWVNTYANYLSKSAKEKRNLEKEASKAQTALTRQEWKTNDEKIKRQRKIRQLLMGYK